MNTNCCDPKTAAVALGRWGFGVMFLFYGIGKFFNWSGFVQHLVQQFEKTWLPAWFVAGFGYALPVIETSLGVLLLIGVARNVVFGAAGVLLIVFTFGQVLLQDPQGVFMNIGYLIFVVVLLFVAEHDRWVPGRGARSPHRPQ